MLVSILFYSYSYKPTLNYFKKHIFYRNVYDAFFEQHDLTKDGIYIHEKKCGLDIEDFHRVLRTIGYLNLQEGEIEFDKDKILGILKKAKDICIGINFKESDFLNDLTYNVPLLRKEGNSFLWIHKSFQEYFAAQFICHDAKDKQKEILNRIYQSDRFNDYLNTLDFCYDIDYKSFRNTIIYNLLNEFIEYFDNSYNKISGINKKDITLRKELCFKTVYLLSNTGLIFPDYKTPIQTVTLSLHKKYFSNFEARRRLFSFRGISKIGILTISFDNKFYYLIQLLHNKRAHFLRINNPNIKATKWPNLKKNTELLIDDDPDIILNNREFFHVANKYLGIDRTVLDFEKSKKLKLQIEEEMKKEEEAEDLLFIP